MKANFLILAIFIFTISCSKNINYHQENQELGKDNRDEANKILNSKFKITNSYAKNLLKHAPLVHNNLEGIKSNNCNKGIVSYWMYSDSLRTKKIDFYSLTKYRESTRQMEYSIDGSTSYSRETNLYYNKFNLIDSILFTTTSEGKIEFGKVRYIYQKDSFSIISIGKFENSLSAKYQLNSIQQCINSKSINSTGNVVWETYYKYDKQGRLFESTRDNYRIEYFYEDLKSKILSGVSTYEGKNLRSQNKYYTKDGYYHIETFYDGKFA